MGVSDSTDPSGKTGQSLSTDVNEKIPQWIREANIPTQLNDMICLLNSYRFFVCPPCTEPCFLILYPTFVNLCHYLSVILKRTVTQSQSPLNPNESILKSYIW